ncbi:MAG: peptidylprolyl isomerase [Gemmatimonadota bacterium]
MVMNKMREWTKWIMVVTALAFVALMVFEWGMDASGQTAAGLGGGEMGKVNGDPISYEVWIPTYQLLYDRRQQAQARPLTSAQAREIEDETWEQLISQVLIRQELQRRDIDVSADEVRQAARFAPPPDFRTNALFQTDGRFDLTKYHDYLSSPAVDPRLLAQLEAYYRDRIPQSKLLQQLSTGVFLSDGELWTDYRDRNEAVQIEYVLVEPGRLVTGDRINVTEDDVAEYYREHREDFREAASAELRIASVDKTPAAADTAAALARAQAARQEIVDGADFGEVATRESSDVVSAQAGGSLGSFNRGDMAPAFDEAVFAQPVGEVGEPILSRFGYHVIEVTERDGDEASARHILVPIELGPDAEDQLLIVADSLEELGENMPLDSAAARLGLSARTVVIAADRPTAPGYGPLDEAADWVFVDPESDEIPVSPVFENDGIFYMVEILDEREDGVRPLDDVADRIRTQLAAAQRLELAMADAAQLVQRARDAGSLQVLADDDYQIASAGPFTRLDFVSGLGQATQAIGGAFGLQEGAIGGPFETDGRLALVRLVARTEADRAQWESQKDLQRARASQIRRQGIVTAYLNDLRDEARIVDNREAVLRPADTDQGIQGGLFGS